MCSRKIVRQRALFGIHADIYKVACVCDRFLLVEKSACERRESPCACLCACASTILIMRIRQDALSALYKNDASNAEYINEIMGE